MENIKLSVLTPIYNHKIEYLKQCLESLKAQTLKEVEFILIDNGANQESKEMIEMYLKQDSRFKVLHIEENEGYGKAMNLGLNTAKGEYIGIVESDDCVKANMYKYLLNIAQCHDVDIVKSEYNLLYSENAEKIENPAVVFYPKDKLFRVLKKEDMVYPFYGACYWTGIYRRSMLLENQCFFSTNMGASGQDTSFLLLAWMSSKNVYTTNEKLYNYRIDNINSSRYNYIPVSYGTAKECQYLMKWLRNNKERYTTFDKAVYTRIIWNMIANQFYNRMTYGKVNAFERYKFLKKAVAPIVKEILDNYYDYLGYFFSQKEVSVLKFILKHPVIHMIRCFYNKKLKKIIKNIFSVNRIESSVHNIITILGVKIRIKKKTKLKAVAEIESQKIKEMQAVLYDMQKSNIEASALHPKTFGPYKNINYGKDVVIVGCGPTVQFYDMKKNAVHIGVNRAFKSEFINLDYLFVQDFMGEDMALADNYNKETCKKFYAIISDFRLKQVFPKIKRIPLSNVINANASTYILKHDIYQQYPYDISVNPITDIGGTTFSAIQFAFYTNPKKIYLVGCDCSYGHFHSESAHGLGSDLTGQMPFWKILENYYKNHRNKDIEIISINPVGLKGMFKDVYTQSYVDEHPELLAEDIEIIDIKEKVEV